MEPDLIWVHSLSKATKTFQQKTTADEFCCDWHFKGKEIFYDYRKCDIMYCYFLPGNWQRNLN